MQRITRTLSCLLALTFAVAAGADIFEEIRAERLKAGKAAQVEANKVLDAFIASVKADKSIKSQHREAIVKLVDGARQSALPDMAETISTSLTLVDKDFGTAMIALGQERPDAAVKRLRQSVKSKNPFVAAQSKYFLGRAYIQQEIFEDALLPLNDLLKNHRDHTLYAGEAEFLKGVCEAELLKRDEAIKTLEAFLQKHRWTASERMVTGAEVLLGDLRWIKDGTLEDVQQRMEFSGRRLKLADTSKPTQDEQEKIVNILNKLIEEAEKQENQGQGSGSGSGSGQGSGQGSGKGGSPSGNQMPGGPANQSGLPGGPGRVGDLDKIAKNAAEPWGDLNERERAKVMSNMKDRFPERYRELLEQYYRGLLQEGEE